MTSQDVDSAIRILGVETSTKLGSHPYPLGNDMGLEVSVAVDFIDTNELLSAGDQTFSTEELRLPRLIVGKGLWTDLDVYFHFAPVSPELVAAQFGGLLRYRIWHSRVNPMALSIVVHGHALNVRDQFLAFSTAGGLFGAVYGRSITLFLGLEAMAVTGKIFQDYLESGLLAKTDRDGYLNRDLTVAHTYVGLAYYWRSFFAVAQLDRYPSTVFSATVGARL